MHAKCFAKFANDAEGPVETGYNMNSVITPNDENHIGLVIIRDLNAGEEIFCSYGKRDWREIAGFKTSLCIPIKWQVNNFPWFLKHGISSECPIAESQSTTGGTSGGS